MKELGMKKTTFYKVLKEFERISNELHIKQ